VKAYALATLVLSAAIAALGVALLVVTAVRGGGVVGFVVGALFVVAGLGRLYVQVRS
jgi:hypothetical protein